jgi:hypothetical protein
MARKYESADGALDGNEVSANEVYQYLWKEPNSQQELVVDPTLYITLPAGQKRTVSVYDHEAELNDRRHDIKKLSGVSFAAFVRQFTELMRNATV